MQTLLLRTMYKQPLALNLLELLLSRLARPSTKDQLAPQLPLQWDVPVLCSLLVDDGVVMLEVGTEALSLEGNPESVLVHGIGMFGPVTEVVCVEWEGFAEAFDRLRVLIEEDL